MCVFNLNTEGTEKGYLNLCVLRELRVFQFNLQKK
jgi:hypothetical protein